MTKKRTKARPDREFFNPSESDLAASNAKMLSQIVEAREAAECAPSETLLDAITSLVSQRDALQASHDIKAENLEIVRKERDALREERAEMRKKSERDLADMRASLERSCEDQNRLKVENRRLRESLLQCWYWFDDRDNRMTSTELHRLLERAVHPTT